MKELLEDTKFQAVGQMFDQLDTDGSGCIETREFANMLIELDIGLSAEGIMALMEAMAVRQRLTMQRPVPVSQPEWQSSSES